MRHPHNVHTSNLDNDFNPTLSPVYNYKTLLCVSLICLLMLMRIMMRMILLRIPLLRLVVRSFNFDACVLDCIVFVLLLSPTTSCM